MSVYVNSECPKAKLQMVFDLSFKTSWMHVRRCVVDVFVHILRCVALHRTSVNVTVSLWKSSVEIRKR